MSPKATQIVAISKNLSGHFKFSQQLNNIFQIIRFKSTSGIQNFFPSSLYCSQSTFFSHSASHYPCRNSHKVSIIQFAMPHVAFLYPLIRHVGGSKIIRFSIRNTACMIDVCQMKQSEYDTLLVIGIL